MKKANGLLVERFRMQNLAGIINEIEYSYLLEFVFYNSPDEDVPGNKQYVAFNDEENYTVQGNTHGELSHAIKHFGEFDTNKLLASLNGAIEYIKTTNNLILKNINGSVIANGDVAKKQLTPNAVLNTFDLINDKILNGQQLTPEENTIKTKFMDPLNAQYNQLVNNFISNSVEIDNKNKEEIENLISAKKKLKFKGSYKGTEYDYILDPSNTGMLAKKGDNVSTLFRIDKKGSDLNKVAAYFSRGVEISNPEFKKVLNI